MSFTNFAARRILNSFLGGATPQSPSYGQLTGNVPTHFGYHVGGTAPNEAGSNFSEPSGNGYARFPIATGAAGWTIATDADPSVAESSSSVTFSAASGGNHGDVTHIGIFDALTGGNLLFVLALTATRTINDGEALSFNANEIDLTLD